jgi:hypothetical protein
MRDDQHPAAPGSDPATDHDDNDGVEIIDVCVMIDIGLKKTTISVG